MSGLSRNNRNREFLYRQLASILRDEINNGKYKPGERLPSMDDLAATYNVNKVTVRRAMAELRSAGLIYSIPAQGTYVSEQPQAQAAPARGQTLTIGLISHILVPGNIGLYHMDIIEGIRAEVSKHQANLVILPVWHIDPQIRILDLILQARLDAAIFLGPFDQMPLRRMIEAGPPAVLLDHELRGAQVDSILVDNRGGGYQAMEHLIQLGHRSLAVVCGPEDQGVSNERLLGTYEAMEGHGLPKSSLHSIPGTFERESGYRAMAQLLEAGTGNVPTGIFCLNDEMAAGALQALHTVSSMHVPEDISIIGFDDTSWATATQPPLTTIHIPRQFMGRLAVQRVVSRLNDKAHTATTTVASTRIITRGSTAPMPKQGVLAS
jgi:DNA-binding LacI/PurR family transcriptional regulator